jgi:lipoprotein-anchoring transpeptidase ErfK/SrfK
MRSRGIKPAAALVAAVVAGGLAVGDVAVARAAGPSRPAAPTVSWIQTGLAERGYLPRTDISGSMDERTQQALLAFQGWERLQRDGIAGPATLRRLATAARPTPLLGVGTRIEIHLDRQVALLVRGDRVARAIHISTGGPATPTPTGTFQVFRKERESWSFPYRVWLPWASYFSGGVALHGYGDVPAYAASHGCVRIPLPEAPTVYAFARLGVSVRVLR